MPSQRNFIYTPVAEDKMVEFYLKKFSKVSIVPVKNFYHHFKNNILSLRKSWTESLIIFEKEFHQGKVTKWMVFMSIRVGLQRLATFGVSGTKSDAHDVCAQSLYEHLLTRRPRLFMPTYAIGFPNVRGHCFLISTLLPLFHCYPFVHQLLHYYGVYTSQRNGGILKVQPTNFTDKEEAFHWTMILYRMYKIYYEKAVLGTLTLENVGRLMARINQNLIIPYTENRDDIDMDRELIKGVVISLRNFCRQDYGTPGGWEQITYQEIMYKLCSEIPELTEKFMIIMSCSYLCGRCTGGPHTGLFKTPLIFLPSGECFQDALENPETLYLCQRFRCTRQVNNIICGGEIREIKNISVHNRPEIVCITFDRDWDLERVIVPEEIIIKCKDALWQRYTRLSSTNIFTCWKTHDDSKNYGDLYHEPSPTDICTGAHTYVTLKTSSRYIEINNGRLYTLDQRLFKRATGGSLHLYQLPQYDRHLPLINFTEIYQNPCW